MPQMDPRDSQNRLLRNRHINRLTRVRFLNLLAFTRTTCAGRAWFWHWCRKIDCHVINLLRLVVRVDHGRNGGLWGGGVKLEKFWNKRAQINSVGWQYTRVDNNKTKTREVASAAPHLITPAYGKMKREKVKYVYFLFFYLLVSYFEGEFWRRHDSTLNNIAHLAGELRKENLGRSFGIAQSAMMKLGTGIKHIVMTQSVYMMIMLIRNTPPHLDEFLGVRHEGCPICCQFGHMNLGGSKMEKFMKQKSYQLDWLTTHKGWKQQNKQSPGQSLLQHYISSLCEHLNWQSTWPYKGLSKFLQWGFSRGTLRTLCNCWKESWLPETCRVNGELSEKVLCTIWYDLWL